VTLTDAVSLYLEHRRTQVSANTLLADRAALGRLVRLLGPVGVESVTAVEIDRFVEDMADTSASSRNLRVRKVRQFFGWCQRRGLVESNPVERRPEREDPFDPIFIPPERFGDLLDCTNNPRDRMVVAVGLHLFLRSSEMQTLRVGDLDFAAGRIKTVQHKTAGVDRMPISADLERELHDYLAWYWRESTYGDESYLLPALRRVSSAPAAYPGYGRFQRVPTRLEVEPRLPVSKPHRIVQSALAELGMPVFRQGGHTLRRSGARALFDRLRHDQGVDGALQVVKSMLHHRDQAMTERYLGIMPEREIRDSLVAGQEMFVTSTDATVVQLSAWRK
jgi:integrase